MTTEDKRAYFYEDLVLIQDINLRNAVSEFLVDEVPEYFWRIPASWTGNYHPKFALGEQGLLRHVKAALVVARELLRLYSKLTPEQCDSVYAAILLHDAFKYGLTDPEATDPEHSQHAFTNHGQLAADIWIEFCETRDLSFSKDIVDAVRHHMTQWGGNAPYEDLKTPVEQIVAMSDFIASRRCIDFPSAYIVEEDES